MTSEEAIQVLESMKSEENYNALIDLCNMAIEALSIVRCKDCRHAEHRSQMPNQVYCHRDKLSTSCAVHDDDDFCKHGERKGGGSE